jgi:hypothetical protein
LIYYNFNKRLGSLKKELKVRTFFMQFKSWFEISQNKSIILKGLIKMGKQYQALTNEDINFIKKQKVFYIASSSGKEVNLSPKGYDSIRVINNSKLIFLNLVGSGNRTNRDSENNGEFTLVFNSFEEELKILRIFCKTNIIKKIIPNI